MTSRENKLLEQYNTLLSESARYGESNDCSVKAIAMLCDLSYNEAHKLCYNNGRRARRGYLTARLKILINSLSNTEPEQLIRQPNGSKYTVKTIPEALPFGKYFIFTCDHVLAMIDGNIYDWTEDRKHRVTSVIEIDKTKMLDLL